MFSVEIKKKNKHEITRWYFFIRHSTKQMKGWKNHGTHHLCSHTQCKGNNQSPLFRTWPIEGVLSQHQSREDIQALLTVLFIRNYPFLDDKKTQKFREELHKPKGNSLLLLPKACGLVINWVFLQTSYVLWTELTECRFSYSVNSVILPIYTLGMCAANTNIG